MMKQQVKHEQIEPVRKKLEVKLPAEDAFRLFTEGINKWWPLVTHSVWGEGAESCYFEGWVGGRIVEVSKHGEESEWGKVLVWEPYTRVSFQWYPDRTPETAQEVTVTVRAVNATSTEVLKYLQEKGILPGARVTVIEAAPLDGPLTLLVNGREAALGLSMAEFVIVEKTVNEGR